MPADASAAQYTQEYLQQYYAAYQYQQPPAPPPVATSVPQNPSLYNNPTPYEYTNHPLPSHPHQIPPNTISNKESPHSSPMDWSSVEPSPKQQCISSLETNYPGGRIGRETDRSQPVSHPSAAPHSHNSQRPQIPRNEHSTQASHSQNDKPQRPEVDTRKQNFENNKQRNLCKKFCSNTVIKVVELYNREEKIDKEEFKRICRKLTHAVLEKEERNDYVISEVTGLKIQKFVDQYFCSNAKFKTHPRVQKLKQK